MKRSPALFEPMELIGRRKFLKQLAVLPAAFAVARSAFSAADDPFEFLVVGDSLVWGQGLEEKDKFYTLTKQWLETGAFESVTSVNLKVKAHSGATLQFHANEAAAFRKAGRDERDYFPSEVNVGFPSIIAQLDIARGEYPAPERVGLILLSGGVTDISVAAILNPFGNNDQLRSDIDRYCLGSMSEVLRHAAQIFPNAVIAVVGYYPMISMKTPAKELFNFTLEAYGIPRPLKPLANNGLTRQFFKVIRKKAVVRSRIWSEHSGLRLREAIDRMNSEAGTARAVFVNAPISEDTTYGTPGSLVFRMGRKGRIEDAFYDERVRVCGPTLDEIKKTTELRYPVRFCEMAAVGHPDPSGSRAFAEAIKATVGPLLAARKQNEV